MKNDFGTKFRSWLKKNKGLTERSSKDILSRLKRCNSFVNIIPALTVQHYHFDLSLHANFCSLSPSVKSQLKQAAKLYYEYSNGTKEELDEIEEYFRANKDIPPPLKHKPAL